MKSVKDLLQNRELQHIIDWDLHPFEAVTRYMEWGTNWSRGLDHAKSCNEESAYFKIDARTKPARLLLVRQNHKEYEVISQVEAPQKLIDDSVEHFACKNAACGITNELRAWLRSEADARS